MVMEIKAVEDSQLSPLIHKKATNHARNQTKTTGFDRFSIQKGITVLPVAFPELF
jgi:hypothetical protein